MSNRHPASRLVGILDSLTLAASLDTAVRLARSFRLRKAGVDPTAQESFRVAASRLRRLACTLQEVVGKLRVHRLFEIEDVPAEAQIIRRFEQLMLVRRGAESLRIAHQSLLSLYPAVDASIVEQARKLRDEWETAADAGFEDLAAADEIEEFIDRIRRPTHGIDAR